MSSRRTLVLRAEIALAGVTLAAVFGMSRLFEGGTWLGPLAANVLAAHLVATAARRRGWGLPTSGVLMILGAGLVTAWSLYWSTTRAGIPTTQTWSSMTDDLGAAWRLYQDVVAPAPAETGFLVVSCLAVWSIAYVADWAAFRLWVPFEATLPAGTLFVFTALLGTERGRTWSIALYASSVLAFLLLHRLSRQDGTSHWVAERADLGRRWLLTAGAGLAAVAVLAGSLLGPVVPGAGSAGVLDPRSLSGNDGGRVTVSPLVDIQSRLVDQADVEVFQVRSPERAYWRLTSLERFDGQIWSSSGTYSKAGETLPESVPTDLASESIEQEFTIEALSAIWLPAAYEPRALAVDGTTVRYDDVSATLIVDDDAPDSDSLVYRVTSASPRINGDDLDELDATVPDSIADAYLELPEEFSPTARDIAEQVTEGADTPAAKARALQDHLRGFEYSLDVQSGHSDDQIVRFLVETQKGYCEQFAGAFAAMARAVGLPSRVAVGFTPGEEDPDEPGLYRVRGEYAHAWPEVYIEGAGWVAYEPTPGRGIPAAEAYTGVPEEQAAPNDPGSSVTIPPTSTVPTIPSTGSQDQPAPRDPDANVAAGDRNDPGAGGDAIHTRYLLNPLRRFVPVVGALLIAYLLLLPLGLLLARWRRRRHATSPLDRIELAWTEITDEARMVGYETTPSQTFRERAGRLEAAVPGAEEEAQVLAGCVELGLYSDVGATEADATMAEAVSWEIRRHIKELAPRTARLRRWLDPRLAIRRWQVERSAGQRTITVSARGDLERERDLVG